MQDIPGFEGRYAVTEDGNVWSYPKKWIAGKAQKRSHNGKWLAQCVDKRGYAHVAFPNGKQKTMPVHRLVAMAYLPNPNSLPAVNHIDAVKANNNVSNLEWVSHGDNVRHAARLNLLNTYKISGANHYRTHLTNEDVHDIRRRHASGESQAALAREYKLTACPIWKIVRYHSWKELS